MAALPPGGLSPPYSVQPSPRPGLAPEAIGGTPSRECLGPWHHSTPHSTGGGQRNGQVAPSMALRDPGVRDPPERGTRLRPRRGAGQHGRYPRLRSAESPPPGGQHGGPGVNRGAVWREEPSPAHSPPPLLPAQSLWPASAQAEGRKVLDDREGGRRGRGSNGEGPQSTSASTQGP